LYNNNNNKGLSLFIFVCVNYNLKTCVCGWWVMVVEGGGQMFPPPHFLGNHLRKYEFWKSGSRIKFIIQLTINQGYNKGMLLTKATPTVPSTTMPLWDTYWVEI